MDQRLKSLSDTYEATLADVDTRLRQLVAAQEEKLAEVSDRQERQQRQLEHMQGAHTEMVAKMEEATRALSDLSVLNNNLSEISPPTRS